MSDTTSSRSQRRHTAQKRLFKLLGPEARTQDRIDFIREHTPEFPDLVARLLGQGQQLDPDVFHVIGNIRAGHLVDLAGNPHLSTAGYQKLERWGRKFFAGSGGLSEMGQQVVNQLSRQDYTLSPKTLEAFAGAPLPSDPAQTPESIIARLLDVSRMPEALFEYLGQAILARENIHQARQLVQHPQALERTELLEAVGKQFTATSVQKALAQLDSRKRLPENLRLRLMESGNWEVMYPLAGRADPKEFAEIFQAVLPENVQQADRLTCAYGMLRRASDKQRAALTAEAIGRLLQHPEKEIRSFALRCLSQAPGDGRDSRRGR